MRYSSGKRADGLHFVRLLKLFLQTVLLRLRHLPLRNVDDGNQDLGPGIFIPFGQGHMNRHVTLFIGKRQSRILIVKNRPSFRQGGQYIPARIKGTGQKMLIDAGQELFLIRRTVYLQGRPVYFLEPDLGPAPPDPFWLIRPMPPQHHFFRIQVAGHLL